jgi:uncharacterized protein YbjT (DUF2867 family)
MKEASPLFKIKQILVKAIISECCSVQLLPKMINLLFGGSITLRVPEIHLVTGAFGFSGRYIARHLLDSGCMVATLTNSSNRPNPFGERIEVHPLSFNDPDRLERALEGVKVLYNTYYVRFNYTRPGMTFTYAGAVRNSSKLFWAAKRAGVEKVVHVSITNPSKDSELEYFRGKAEIEQLLIESGISYSILRPAVLYGDEGILINNIAWLLRRFPVFGVFGDGNYRLQPIYVNDLAELAVREGRHGNNAIIDAIGPETFTYRGLVETIGHLIGKPRPIVSIPPDVGLVLAKILGGIVQDRLLTRDEIKGLMSGLLYVDSPPAGKTKLTDWVRENSHELGTKYFSELGRRYYRQVRVFCEF